MRKIILVLAVLALASPTMAAVSITATADGNDVTISYDSGADLVRAFALDITVDNGAIISGVSGLSADYQIYPGSIDINDVGEVNDYGSPVCSPDYPGTLGGLGTSGVTIEMGSLYVGEGNAPGLTGDLLTITIDCNGAEDCNVMLAANTIRGGAVVMEDGTTPTPTLTGCTAICDSGPARCQDAGQCGGQAIGDVTCDGNINFSDLIALKLSFGKPVGDPAYNCCCDFNHDTNINFTDLITMKLNFGTTGLTPATGAQGCP